MFCPKCGTENPDKGKFCRSCGTDLSVVASVVSGELQTQNNPLTYVDRRGRIRSNNPDDIYSLAIKNLIMGAGFLIASAALFLTGVAGGRTWWWALLFPAFTMIAKGVSEMAKVRRIEKKGIAHPFERPTFIGNQPNQALPPVQTEYIRPQGSIYETGDLVVQPSVTENTTRHLEINTEGETMTLPKK